MFVSFFPTKDNRGRKELVLNEGDWVWLHLRKHRFPTKRKSQLSPRGDRPFQVLERINNNAYRLDLPEECGVSTTFNISNLIPFADGADIEEEEEKKGKSRSKVWMESVIQYILFHSWIRLQL